jgi:hypothetical protein
MMNVFTLRLRAALCALVAAACCAACTSTGGGKTAQSASPAQPVVQVQDSTEWGERQKINLDTINYFLHFTDEGGPDWDGYDKLIQSYTTGLPTTAAGTPKLVLAFECVDDYYSKKFEVMINAPKRARQTFDKENSRLDKWIKRRPQSATFLIAKAILAQSYAWYLRGDGTIDTVNPRIWPEFNAVINGERSFLLKNKAVGQTSPMWYVAMLNLTRAVPGKPSTQELLHEGSQRYPGFMPIYGAALESALPKWGGSPQAVEQVARSAQGTEYSDMVYAYVWHNAVLDCNCNLNDAMVDAARKQASWPDMKRGWEQYAQKYPDGWVYNGYAAMACTMGDKQSFREASARMGPRIVAFEQEWPKGITYEQCMAQK